MESDYVSEKDFDSLTILPNNCSLLYPTDEYVPVKFCGIDTTHFGSSNRKLNPFYKLKTLASSNSTSFEDRIQAIRYMTYIPHIKQKETVLEVVTHILKDETINIDMRYDLFNKTIRFTSSIMLELHKFYFEHFLNEAKHPLLYLILSAQYILTHATKYNFDMITNFLIANAKDSQLSVNLRAECADILHRQGLDEKTQSLGYNIIMKMGNLYVDNKSSCIYSNTQNIHDKAINDSVMSILRYLIAEDNKEKAMRHLKLINLEQELKENKTPELEKYIKEIRDIDILEKDIHTEIYDKISTLVSEEKKCRVMNSLRRVLIDTAKYDGYASRDILIVIWKKVKSQTIELQTQLHSRIIEELHDMDETCSTGHMSRLINVLAGFNIINQNIKISFRDQLRSNIFARLNKELKSMAIYQQQQILDQMISPSKELLEEFILDFNPYEELYNEFVKEENMNEDEFKEIYKKAINDYCGK